MTESTHYSDEDLCAFLDGELSKEKADEIREQLIEDEQLAERIEAFAMVDTQLNETYSKINEQPLPEALEAMLKSHSEGAAEPEQTPASNVVRLSARQRFQRWVPRMAACVTFAVGYGIAAFNQPSTDKDLQVAMSTTPSGNIAVVNQAQVKINFSFENADGAFCRQYTVNETASTSENIACLESTGRWQHIAKIPTANKSPSGEYATASANKVIDNVLDDMMVNGVLDLENESTLILNNWNNAK